MVFKLTLYIGIWGRPKIRWKYKIKNDLAKEKIAEKHAKESSQWRQRIGETK